MSPELWILVALAGATAALVALHVRSRTVPASLADLGSMSERWLAEERAASSSSPPSM